MHNSGSGEKGVLIWTIMGAIEQVEGRCLRGKLVDNYYGNEFDFKSRNVKCEKAVCKAENIGSGVRFASTNLLLNRSPQVQSS